jgi:hypothetical protein
MRFRTSEVFLGVFLSVAVFAIGMLFSSSLRPSEPPKVYVLEKSEAHPSSGFWQKVTEDPVAAFTLVLAISTIILAGSTILLWWVTWQSGLRQAKETEILQRAYVSVDPLGTHLMKDGGHIIGHVAIKNAGNLPATHLSWFINIKHTSGGEETGFPLEATKGRIVVAPHSETERGSDNKLVLQDLLDASNAKVNDRAKENPLYIYVWGMVRYHDGFTAGRTTQFCHRYNWINRPEAINPARCEINKEFARQHTEGNATT